MYSGCWALTWHVGSAQDLLGVPIISSLHCLLLCGERCPTPIPDARAPVQEARAEVEGLSLPPQELVSVGTSSPQHLCKPFCVL